MDYKQNEWLYDILRKHGFDEAVQAFKDNIAALGFDGKLAHWVGEEVAKLDIATVSREEYVKNRLAEWEREMLEMRTLANDDMKCDRYNVGIIIWNYVLAEAVKAALLKLANIQPQPTATGQQAANNETQREYSAGLVKLFHGHIELIDELVGLSDDGIARKIKGWAKQKDNLGKSLIENPENRLRTLFATKLKANGLITGKINTFKRKL